MCGPNPPKLARAHPCALLAPARSTSHTWSFSFILHDGDFSPPGAVPRSRGRLGRLRLKEGALQETLGFCAFRHTQGKDAAGSSRDALNREQEQTQTWFSGLFLLAWLSGLTSPECSHTSLQAAKLWSWDTPPWAGPSLPGLLALGSPGFTWDRSHHLHPVLSQAPEGYPGTATAPGFRFWAPLGLNTAEIWSRGIGITSQVKNDKDQSTPQHLLGHGQANLPSSTLLQPPRTPGKGKML